MNRKSVQAPERKSLVSSILVLFAICCLSLNANISHSMSANISNVAWAENDGQKFEIFYASHNGQSWNKTIQITNDQYDNMHPSMAAAPNGDIWLVWTALNGLKNKIFYSVEHNNSWSFPQEIETGLQSSFAPKISIMGNGVPWITWAGYNGRNDDIYTSHWDKQHWTKPQMIHPANDTPDILPEIIIKHEKPVIVWQSYVEDKYQWFESQWNGKFWSTQSPLTDEELLNLKNRHDQDEYYQNSLPDFVHVTGKASILVN